MSNSSSGWILFHNGDCSKSRQVKDILTASSAVFSVVNYLVDPPSPQYLLQLCEKGEFTIKQLVRFGEPTASALTLSADDVRSDEEWSRYLHENPILIERPIVETPTRAMIGRPPEIIMTLLEK